MDVLGLHFYVTIIGSVNEHNVEFAKSGSPKRSSLLAMIRYSCRGNYKNRVSITRYAHATFIKAENYILIVAISHEHSLKCHAQEALTKVEPAL
jgi:hypothetical protein